MYRGEVGGFRLCHALQRMVDYLSHPPFCRSRHSSLGLASGKQLSAKRTQLIQGDRMPSAAPPGAAAISGDSISWGRGKIKKARPVVAGRR